MLRAASLTAKLHRICLTMRLKREPWCCSRLLQRKLEQFYTLILLHSGMYRPALANEALTPKEYRSTFPDNASTRSAQLLLRVGRLVNNRCSNFCYYVLTGANRCMSLVCKVALHRRTVRAALLGSSQHSRVHHVEPTKAATRSRTFEQCQLQKVGLPQSFPKVGKE